MEERSESSSSESTEDSRSESASTVAWDFGRRRYRCADGVDLELSARPAGGRRPRDPRRNAIVCEKDEKSGR